ncbi:MAG: hypothetical protein ABW000_07180 [Actinoplanes sp.]
MVETYQDPRVRRPKPDAHGYQPDMTVPAAGPRQPRPCRCGLAKANALHDPARIAAITRAAHEAQAEERRRLGERED